MKIETISSKARRWKLIKINEDGDEVATIYNSFIGLVNSDHVRTAPSVRRWLGRDKMKSILPAAE